MDNQAKNLLAAAVVGGYVLGRAKKGRIALTAATFLAGRGMGLDPRSLVVEGVRRIGEIPQVVALQAQLRDESMEVGRNALTAVANRSLHALADTIAARTAGIGRGPDGEGAAEAERGDETPEDEERQDEAAADEEAEDREAEDEEAEVAPRRPRSSRRPDRSEQVGRGAEKGQVERSASRRATPARSTASPKRTRKTSARDERGGSRT